MKSPLVIYWSRKDFRLHDNPALHEALSFAKDNSIPFVPIYILEPYMTSGSSKYQFGYPSRYMISHALPQFAEQFERFVTVHHTAAAYFKHLSKTYTLHVYVNEDVYPDFYTQIQKMTEAGIAVQVLRDRVTVPKDIKTGTGNIYSVFTPFKNAVWDKFVHSKPLPKANVSLATYIKASDVKNWTHTINATQKDILRLFSTERTLQVGKVHIDLSKHTTLPDLTTWYTSEDAALKSFKSYAARNGVQEYKLNRDSLEGDTEKHGLTSKMSVALAHGFISSRTLVDIIQKEIPHFEKNDGALCYISELIWREFYGYLMYNHKDLMHTEFQKKYRNNIAWVTGTEATKRFTAWITGTTGYPIVDAAMKQLEKTGWMHNRARMIVSSVLTKNLGVDWRLGQEYFRATLIDLDEASNNGGWQWGASVGADPKPIRIFNPTLQAETHDKTGAYQEKWLGVFKNQRAPIVDQKTARNEALRRYHLL